MYTEPTEPPIWSQTALSQFLCSLQLLKCAHHWTQPLQHGAEL